MSLTKMFVFGNAYREVYMWLGRSSVARFFKWIATPCSLVREGTLITLPLRRALRRGRFLLAAVQKNGSLRHVPWLAKVTSTVRLCEVRWRTVAVYLSP